MIIGGLQKNSLIDYPGKIAAVIFLQGCNFRCPFCHNPQLVVPNRYEGRVPITEVIDFLMERKGQLDGVVVTGGEPTMHPELPNLLQIVKDMGYAVKLDTNGSHPHVLREIINNGVVDFIAMDVKAPLKKYPELSGVSIDISLITRSIKIIKDSCIDHQFRTTVHPSLLAIQDIANIQSLIGSDEKLSIQEFEAADDIVDASLKNNHPHT